MLLSQSGRQPCVLFVFASTDPRSTSCTWKTPELPCRVRVAVQACGMNPVDWARCNGLFAGTLPRGIGLEVSGIVDAIGDGGRRIAPESGGDGAPRAGRARTRRRVGARGWDHGRIRRSANRAPA
ncbi:alcohol dehydrogenase catalytic domain-containing protein [Amycolatopsis jejuensis]|uniref:alcohol dehydrogenase catalytic domain-containing protein n=1 Tax=Amycolatopsis jejuensis TaxID=330084 RepID=UPI003CCC16F5